MTKNRQIVLENRPAGSPKDSDFRLAQSEVPPLQEGQALVRNSHFSIEPAVRGFIDDSEANYLPPLERGDAIRSPVIGTVVESRRDDFHPGDVVRALLSWEEYSIISDDTILLEKISPAAGVPLSYYTGPLGMSGLTAFIGLHEIGQIKAGETVVISAATGAVGSIAGQIARLRGCRVIALVGSPEKKRLAIEELGYDAAIDYRQCDDLGAEVRALCPDGVDIYFDNVGGAMLDAMLMCMGNFGRIVGCGMISAYNRQDDPPPVLNLWQIVARELTMKGFLLYSHAGAIPDALRQLEEWVVSGELTILENKRHGIEQTVPLFCELMAGTTIGKSVIELDPPG